MTASMTNAPTMTARFASPSQVADTLSTLWSGPKQPDTGET